MLFLTNAQQFAAAPLLLLISAAECEQKQFTVRPVTPAAPASTRPPLPSPASRPTAPAQLVRSLLAAAALVSRQPLIITCAVFVILLPPARPFTHMQSACRPLFIPAPHSSHLLAGFSMLFKKNFRGELCILFVGGL
jgi:hypothetical protein